MHYPMAVREPIAPPARVRRASVAWHEVRDVTPDGGISNNELARMVHSARQGGVALLASDTGYAFVADPFSQRARAFIDSVRRDPGALYPLSFGSMAMLTDYVRVGSSEAGILRHLTPGPVTPVLDVRRDLPEHDAIVRKLRTPGTIAARLPDRTLETALSNELRGPVTTAALRHPDGSIVTDYDVARELLAERLEDVEPLPLTVARGAVRYGEHSTMVRLTHRDFEPPLLKILREGPIDHATIADASRDVWFDIDTT